MDGTTTSPVEAVMSVLVVRGTFLHVIPVADFTPQRPRAASTPATWGHSGRAERLAGSAFAARVQQLSKSIADSRTRGGDPRGGADCSSYRTVVDRPGGGQHSTDVLGGKCPARAPSRAAGGGAVDGRTLKRSAAPLAGETRSRSNLSAESAKTRCPQWNEVLGDDPTEWLSSTSTGAAQWNEVLGDDLTKRLSSTSTGDDDNSTSRVPSRHAGLDRQPSSAGSDSSPSPSGPRGRTLMLRNIPCRIKQQELASVIDEQGFGGRYNSVHMPQSYRASNIGYAFVRLIDEADEEAFKLAFNGYRFGDTLSQKVC